MDKGLYLYCVAEGPNVQPVQGSREEDLKLKGIEGENVFTLVAEGLSAVVQESDSSFSSEDPKRISEWVLTHQAVVDFAWERFGTGVPFGFGTVIVAKNGKSARENLLEWMGKERDVLRGKLEKLKGKAEYGVQISWDLTMVTPKGTQHDKEIKRLEEQIHSQPPGTAYLLKQKLGNLLRQRLEAAADIYFKEFYRKIKECVEEVRVEKVRKEDPPRQMLMNLSCLVLKDTISHLGDELEKIGKMEGFYVRFTGPWPPYSFANP